MKPLKYSKKKQTKNHIEKLKYKINGNETGNKKK